MFNKKIYNSDDIQEMLVVLHRDQNLKEALFKQLEKDKITASDQMAIRHAVKEAWYEVLDRYDSMVTEYLITAYEKITENYQK